MLPEQQLPFGGCGCFGAGPERGWGLCASRGAHREKGGLGHQPHGFCFRRFLSRLLLLFRVSVCQVPGFRGGQAPCSRPPLPLHSHPFFLPSSPAPAPLPSLGFCFWLLLFHLHCSDPLLGPWSLFSSLSPAADRCLPRGCRVGPFTPTPCTSSHLVQREASDSETYQRALGGTQQPPGKPAVELTQC